MYRAALHITGQKNLLWLAVRVHHAPCCWMVDHLLRLLSQCVPSAPPGTDFFLLQFPGFFLFIGVDQYHKHMYHHWFMARESALLKAWIWKSLGHASSPSASASTKGRCVSSCHKKHLGNIFTGSSEWLNDLRLDCFETLEPTFLKCI